MIKNKTRTTWFQVLIGHKTPALLLVFLFLITPLTPILAKESPSSVIPNPKTSINQEQISNTEIGLETLQEVPIPTIGEVQTETLKDEEPLPEEVPEIPKEKQSPYMSVANTDTKSQTMGKYLSSTVSVIDGSLNYQYPIAVPPGRNNLTPDIKLIYDSSNKSENSILGIGWSLNIPYIQRMNKKGVNKLYSENDFVSSLDGELIEQGNGIYTPRTENGSFLKYKFENNYNYWIVTDKTGTQYKFGITAQSRQDNPNNSSKVFSWMLEQIIDTNGNSISYTYFKEQGQIYPSVISYNQFTIEFAYTSSNHINSSFLYVKSFKLFQVITLKN